MPKVWYIRHLFSEMEGSPNENHQLRRLEERAESPLFVCGKGYFWAPPSNQDTWLLQATFTYKAIYKPTKPSRTRMLQTYESCRTYKPINLFQKPPQPGGPVGVGGFWKTDEFGDNDTISLEILQLLLNMQPRNLKIVVLCCMCHCMCRFCVCAPKINCADTITQLGGWNSNV